MIEYTQIRYWVNDLPKLGRNTFSLSEVREVFPHKPPSQIKNALSRLVSSGKIVSVWQGFYVILLPEYGIKGLVPPLEYIDHLMCYLGKDYYVSTLSAAALHGASHHKPLTLTFVCNQILHHKQKYEISLEPLLKKRIPYDYIEKKNVHSGTINVSTAALTAIDLVLYPLKSGGFGNVATILAELSESISPHNLGSDFVNLIPISTVQRLGYLFDVVLENSILADTLYETADSMALNFRKVALAPYQRTGTTDGFYDKRWKVVVNEVIEVDI